SRGVDQVRVQEGTARPQMRTDVPVNLADAFEVSQVVQAAGGNNGVERAKLLGQPADLEEVGPMKLEALPVLRREVSCAIQHPLGAILRSARRARFPLEDEHAAGSVAGTDTPDGAGCVIGEWTHAADHLKPSGSTRVFRLLPLRPV